MWQDYSKFLTDFPVDRCILSEELWLYVAISDVIDIIYVKLKMTWRNLENIYLSFWKSVKIGTIRENNSKQPTKSICNDAQKATQQLVTLMCCLPEMSIISVQ